MKLLLVRHGETVDNVSQIFAGTRDSPLTNHGVLQASRLGSYLASNKASISTILSSDLQRAFNTAESIRLAQPTPPRETTATKLLRERDFGPYEGRPFSERRCHSIVRNVSSESTSNNLGPEDVESADSMSLRIDTFIDSHLVKHIEQTADQETVVVVAHGVILSYLWRGILDLFEHQDASIAPTAILPDCVTDLRYIGGWSNTGYMDLEIKRKPVSVHAVDPFSKAKPPQAPGLMNDRVVHISHVSDPTSQPITASVISPLSTSHSSTTPTPTQRQQKTLLHRTLVVRAVNSKTHLQGLKKTRGGIGSLRHDEKQRTMDSFVKRRRIE